MNKILKIIEIVIALLVFSSTASGSLVDTDNQPVTTNTTLGDIDMSIGTLGDMSQFIAPSFETVSNAALNAVSKSDAADVIKDVVTNTVTVGYTDWEYRGDTSAGVTYSITSEPSGQNYVFTLWDFMQGTQLGTSTTNMMYPTFLSFTVTAGTITASRDPVQRNANGLAMYSDVKQLSDKIDQMDTSYFRVIGITNKNQSVQYVYTDETVTELQIQMPESGMTKDWLVYILSVSNLTLKLPPANYWVVNETVTNDIPYLTPTALYFSQINDDTYSIGRQSFIPVTVQSQQMLLNQSIMRTVRKRNKKIFSNTSNAVLKSSNTQKK